MKKDWKKILGIFLSGFMCSGCAYTSAVAPEGTVTVKADASDTTTQKNASAYVPRLIVIQYWSNERVDNIPSSIELIQAFVAETDSFPVKFPLRAYPVLWTIPLGAMHFCPDPEIVVFASGYWPAVCNGEDQPRYGGQAPRDTPYRYSAVLKKDVGIPPMAYPIGAWDIERFPPLLYQLDSLDRILQSGKTITDSDRLMVYQQMKKQVDAWQESLEKGEVIVDAETYHRAVAVLDEHIGKLQHKTAGK